MKWGVLIKRQGCGRVIRASGLYVFNGAVARRGLEEIKPSLMLRMSLFFCAILTVSADIQAETEVPHIAVSNRPMHSLVSALISGTGSPTLILRDDLPLWQQSPDSPLSNALVPVDLLVWAGRELEPGLLEAVEAHREQHGVGSVFEALSSETLKLLPRRGHEERVDPFFWLDTRNMLILLDEMMAWLVETDPERRSVYEINYRNVTARLSSLDRQLEFDYRSVSGVPVFFYHDTHQYFEQAYALHMGGSVQAAGADSLDNESAETLLQMHSLLKERDVACFAIDQSLPAENLALLQTKTNLEVIELDVFGVSLAPGPELYPALMQQNFDAIAECVRGKGRDEIRSEQPSLFPEPDERRFPPLVQPRYLLADSYGRAVSNDAFEGLWQLIFFGFTSCPDICPTTLATVTQVLRALGEDSSQLQPVFITVDPSRDTAVHLSQYLEYFDNRIIGLRGSAEATKRTAELFRARFRYVPASDGSDEYSVDHTASLYLLGPGGEFVTKFPYGMPIPELAARIQAYMDGRS